MRSNVYLIIVLSFFIAGAETFLGLRQVEEEAVEHNLNKQSLDMEEEATRWQKISAVGTYLPSFMYSGSYTRSDMESPFTGFQPGMGMPGGQFGALYENSFSHQFSLNLPLSNGGSEIIVLRLSNQMLAAINHRQEDTRQQIILDIRKTYLNAAVTAEQITVNKRSIEWAQKNLEKAKIKLMAETIPKNEVLRWEAEVLDREVSHRESQAQYRELLLYLLLQRGKKIDTSEIASIHLDSLSFFERLYDKQVIAPEGIVQEHPFFKVLALQEEMSREQVRLEKARLFPRLNAFYSLQWPADSVLLPESKRYWMAGLRLDIPLVPGLSIFSDIKKSGYDQKKSAYTFEAARRQLQVSQLSAQEHLEAAHQEVRAAKKRRDVLTETVAMMQDRYEGGLANQTELLETALQTDLARTGYIRTLFMYLIYKAEYLRSIGKLEVIQ